MHLGMPLVGGERVELYMRGRPGMRPRVGDQGDCERYDMTRWRRPGCKATVNAIAIKVRRRYRSNLNAWRA